MEKGDFGRQVIAAFAVVGRFYRPFSTSVPGDNIAVASEIVTLKNV